MGFSVTKAAIYGVALFAALMIGLNLTGGLGSFGATLVFAAAAAVIVGIVFGFIMRDATMEVAAATPDAVAAALNSSWAMRSFKPTDIGGGAIRYRRGFGPLVDSFTVTPTATGVTLSGPYNIIRIVKDKAGG